MIFYQQFFLQQPCNSDRSGIALIVCLIRLKPQIPFQCLRYSLFFRLAAACEQLFDCSWRNLMKNRFRPLPCDKVSDTYDLAEYLRFVRKA